MNIKEAKEIINVLVASYPNTYKDFTEEQFSLMAKLWTDAFKNIPAALVKKALTVVMYNQTSNFAPNIGMVNAELRKIITVFDAQKEWDNVMWIVHNVTEKLHRAPKSYLDEISQSIVDETYLRKLKEDSKYCEFERNNFIKRYNEEKDWRERKAIETGNLSLMCSESKMQELGITRTSELAIEHNDNTGAQA